MLRIPAIFSAFLRRDLRIQFSYRLALFSQVAALASSVLTVYFLSRYVGKAPALGESQAYGTSVSYFAFAMCGLVVADWFTVALRGFGAAIRSAMVEGQLEAMLATGAPPGLIIGGSGLHPFLWTLARSVALLLAATGLGAQWNHAHWGLACAALALAGCCAASLGATAAALTLVFKKGEPLTALVAGSTVLLSGVLYPPQSLPPAAEALSRVLPATHALEAFRLAALGGPEASAASALVPLLLWAVALVPVAALAVHWAVRRVREDGSADQF